MDKIDVILEFYCLTNKLKDTIRSGWKYWNVKAERLESVAEHVFGTCMLATAIWAETLPPVNLPEVLMTLAIHETEEIIIGDLTPFDNGYSEKAKQGRVAVQNIFKNMMAKDIFTNLIQNFDNKATPEAIFAYKCDKLECDLQAKLYDEKGFCKFEDVDEKIKNSERIQKLHDKGVKKVSSFFNYYDRENMQKFTYEREENIFNDILKYIEKNSLLDLEKDFNKPKEVKKAEKENSATPKTASKIIKDKQKN